MLACTRNSSLELQVVSRAACFYNHRAHIGEAFAKGFDRFHERRYESKQTSCSAFGADF
jgi:hypothetical protein